MTALVSVLVLAAAACSSPQAAPVRPTQVATSAPANDTSTVGFTAYPTDRAPALPVLTGADLTGSTLTIPATGAAITVVNVWASCASRA